MDRATLIAEYEAGRRDFRKSNLSDANLSDANLSGADLSWADLSRADLSRADLPSVPVVPELDAAILAAVEAGGELDMHDWHTCATTHCRAGWAITLAGDAGAALEAQYGPNVAGALIYHASAGYVPDFYASNEDALADMRRRAAGGSE